MQDPKNSDTLLTASKLFLDMLFVTLIVVIVVVGNSIGALLIIEKAELIGKIDGAGLHPRTYLEIVAALAGIVAILALTMRFLLELRAIVVSVQEGDPFIEDNAARLRRMAWLALVIQVLAIPTAAMSQDLARFADFHMVRVHASDSGFALVLTLFILARVFAKGAEMRTELEGTI